MKLGYNDASLMKKEVAIAIVIGLFLGLIVTFGIYTARRSSSSVQKSAEMLASTSPGNPNASPSQNSLVISSPEDGLITSDKELQVSGTTEPNSFVFIFFGEEFLLEKADATGNFSTRIPTKAGPLLIEIRTLDESGNSVEDERAVYVGDPNNLSSAISTTSASPRPSATPRVTASPRATPAAQ